MVGEVSPLAGKFSILAVEIGFLVSCLGDVEGWMVNPSFEGEGIGDCLVKGWIVNPSSKGEGIGDCFAEGWMVNGSSFEGEGIGDCLVEGLMVGPSVVAETVSPWGGGGVPLDVVGTGEALEASSFG